MYESHIIYTHDTFKIHIYYIIYMNTYMNIHASSSTITKRLSSLFSTHLYRQELRGREAGRREREREREREGKHVAPYRVFGGNIGAQREQLGYHTWQSVCTRVHEQSLSFHVPLAAVLRVDVHAGGDDGLQQHLDCCFLLSRYRQPNGSAARLIFRVSERESV